MPRKIDYGALPKTGFVRLELVLALIPVSKSTWLRGVEKGIFPQPVYLTERTVAYRAEDIWDLIHRLGAIENELAYAGYSYDLDQPNKAPVP